MNIFKKIATKEGLNESLDNLIKIADILDRVGEDELSNYVDDLISSMVDFHDDKTIQVEVPDEEQGVLAEVFDSLLQDLLQRQK